MSMTNAERKLAKARVQLIKNQPFWGVLALRLRLVPAPDLPSKTLATNGKEIFYYPEWVEKTEPELVESGLAHEVGHCVLQHLGRRQGRAPRKWNYAIDYVTNDMLQQAGFQLGQGWLYDPAFSGMSAEHIYSILPDNDDNGPDNPFDDHTDAEPDPENKLDWEIATMSAAKAQAATSAGKLPKQIQRMLDEIKHPQVDWRTRMQRFARATAKDDYAWQRPSRKMLVMGHILPGPFSERVEDVTGAVDTSGSITDEVLAAFGGELSAIHEEVKPNTLRVIYCDAAVNKVDEFDQTEPPTYKMHGGGGTDFNPPFEWLKENDVTPTAMIYLTDGYGPFPKEEPPFPVLWVMTTDVVPPWGEHVRIEL